METRLTDLLEKLIHMDGVESILRSGIYSVSADRFKELVKLICTRYRLQQGSDSTQTIQKALTVIPKMEALHQSAKETKYHVMKQMTEDHTPILKCLDLLETLRKELFESEIPSLQTNWLKSLKSVGTTLHEAEAHTLLEEEILFPRLELEGVIGPLAVVRDEHEILRHHKMQLNELIRRANEIKLDSFKIKFSGMVGYLLSSLRDHIYIENLFLYPLTLVLIDDKDFWENLLMELRSNQENI